MDVGWIISVDLRVKKVFLFYKIQKSIVFECFLRHQNFKMAYKYFDQ